MANPELTRREFVGGLLGVVGVVGTSELLRRAGVTPTLNGTDGSVRPQRLSPTSAPVPTEFEFPVINQEVVTRAARRSIHNFNTVLGLDIDEDVAVSKVIVGNTKEGFAGLVKNDPSYNSKFNPENYAAFTSTSYDAKGLRTIYVNGPTLEGVTRTYPQTPEGATGQDQFIEDILDHEFVHWSSVRYQSELLNKIVFNNLLAEIPDFKNKKIVMGFVEGAKITCEVDGVQKAAYKDLEEAEALLIAQYIVDHDDKKIELVDNPTPDAIGESTQFTLLTKLLNKLANGGDTSGLIVTLAHLRRKQGGREEWAQMIAEAFGKNNDLDFAMGVLISIDQANQQMFANLTGLS